MFKSLNVINPSHQNFLNGGKRVLKGKKNSNKCNNPRLSIITVVLNGEEYLEHTIKSVLNQKYKNF